MDLLNSEPVVSLSGDEFLPIEGKTFIQQVQEFFAAQGGKANSPFGTVLLDKKGIKNDIGHGIGRLKASSFAAVKDVLEKGVVINPMGQYHTNNKKNPTGMIAAPITIGNEKYVCVVEVIANRQVTRLYVHEVTLTKNLQGDVADSNAVPEDNNLVTQPQGEITKILRNYVNAKNNDDNNIKTENRNMNKKQIRLTESYLKQIVKESVNKILSEAYGTPQKLDKGLNDKIDSYLQYDHTYDPEKDIVWDDRKLYGNGVRYKTTDNKNSSKPFVSNHTYSIDGDDIVPELDTLYKTKQRISTTIYNACTKVGCKPDMFDEIMNSISEKINFVMSTLRKHSFMSRGQDPYYGNMYDK